MSSKWSKFQGPEVGSVRVAGGLRRLVVEVKSPKTAERWWQIHVAGDGFSVTLELEPQLEDGTPLELEAVQELADEVGDTPVAFYELPLRRRAPAVPGEN